MGNEWRETNLGSLTVLKNGKGLKASEYQDDGLYPVWGANGPIARTNHLLNNTPVVVIGRVGAYCGSVHLVNEPNWVTDNAIVAIPKEGNNFRFLYYLLKYIRPERTSIGSAQPLVTQSGLKTLPCKVPTAEKTQRAIAHIIGSLDDKIELNRQMNQTLEKMAQAIFKSWFIDFDPVVWNAVKTGKPAPERFAETAARYQADLSAVASAKAEGRDLGLPKEIADLFPDSFEDSELGEIPKGWEVKTLSSIIELIGGGTPKTKIDEYWNGDIPWFSVVDAPDESDIWVIDTKKHVTQTGVKNSSTKILPIRTTIISARGTVGKCAFVGRPMAMNQSCYGIRPAGGYGEICTNFTVRNQIMALQRSGHGSVFNTITRATFDSIRMADGGCEISAAFDKLVDFYLSAILENLHEASVLIRTRDTLLPQLISGELPISDAEKFIAEAGI